MVKRYALLCLHFNTNKVIAECGPCTFEHALATFRKYAPTLNLDDTGYSPIGAVAEGVSFTMAEFHESFCHVSLDRSGGFATVTP